MPVAKDQIAAIVLAAGHGKRLKPVTDWVPKPLVPVEGAPILPANLERLASFGIRQAVVVYGRPTDLIPDFLAGLTFGPLAVAYAFQAEQRGTGDAFLTGMRVAPEHEHYLLLAGDALYSEEHLQAVWGRYATGDVDGCLLLKELPLYLVGRSSVVVLDQGGCVETMISKPLSSELRASRSHLADASLHIHSCRMVDYLKTAELSRTDELEVTTALRNWVRDGARIAGVIGPPPPHVTDLQDFIVHNIPFGRQLVAIREVERALDDGDDTDLSGLLQSLAVSDIPFIYKRLKKLSTRPMGATRQARVLALISEVFRHQAHSQGFRPDPALDEQLSERTPPEFIAELESRVAADRLDGGVCHYMAVAYARHANRFIADSIFAEARSRMPVSQRPSGLGHRVVVRTPARLAFSSSQGSDISFIIEEKGAVILNCAITVNGSYPGGITIERIPEHHLELVAESFQASAIVRDYDGIFGHVSSNDPLVLLKAGVRFAGMIDPHHDETLADWLEYYGTGIRITVDCSIPRGSGLGCSAILAAGLIRGLREFAGLPTTDAELLLRSYCCERYYGRSGYQDILGGALGGVKLIQADGLSALFEPRIDRLDLRPDQLEAIGRNLLVFYTGKPHFTTPYLLTIPAKYFIRSSDYMYAYENGKQLTHAMAEALCTDDWERMGQLINDYWDDREFFEEGVTPEFAMRLRADLAPLCHGTALCGSGHGGYMMVVPKAGQRANILDYLAANGVGQSAVLDFSVTENGLTVERVD